jgi:hypothetical protein
LGSFLVKIWVFDPPGWPYIGLPTTVLQIILKKEHHALSWMYFCGYFTLSNGPNWEVICIRPIFGFILGKKWVFDLPRWPYIGLPPTVLQLILKKYYHDLSWMYFCGYFALSNGPNWEVIWIIPIFGVIFGQIWVFDPLGWPYIRLPPIVLQIILKKYYHAWSWMYFVVTLHYQMVQIGKLFA